MNQECATLWERDGQAVAEEFVAKLGTRNRTYLLENLENVASASDAMRWLKGALIKDARQRDAA